MRHRVATVFLVLPPDRLDTYARWLRLLIAQALHDVARATDAPSGSQAPSPALSRPLSASQSPTGASEHADPSPGPLSASQGATAARGAPDHLQTASGPQGGSQSPLDAPTAPEGPMPPDGPILFLLDEFAALGRLEAVERAMGLMAGYGLQLWPILQDLSQLKALYGPKASTFVANAGVLQTFGVNDLETAEWLSRLLGRATVGSET